MLKTFLATWGLKIAIGLTIATVAATSWLYVDLTLTKKALEEAREVSEAQANIIESQSRITVREIRTNTIVREATQAIEEAPNAQVLVPNDVAVPWADGIDRLRNDAGITDGATKILPRSDPPKT